VKIDGKVTMSIGLISGHNLLIHRMMIPPPMDQAMIGQRIGQFGSRVRHRSMVFKYSNITRKHMAWPPYNMPKKTQKIPTL